jgi:L-cysteine:1D-myo-inositol 2-amino-2-deoxy-alpha-D-glucopyranoside ligase
MSMQLYDTATGTIRPFDPGPIASLYICGITPYDATHMGHAATYVTYDVLHRRLMDRGHEVRMVRNITDIDNDLLDRARRDGVNYLDLAFGQKRRFDDDLDALGVLDPWSEPRASSAIPDIRGLIARLLESGASYEVAGWVYFDHRATESFGSVSGYTRVDMRTIGEQRGEDPSDRRKRHPLDTVVWQPSAIDEPAWEAPWGSGRPGWHIECTVLSMRELSQIDIHGGGCDLVYPHHEFCAAQLECAGSKPVGHWMHQSCVHLNGEPMSKSTGNLVFVLDALEDFDPMAVRLAVLSQHYRSTEWTWTDDLLDAATDRFELWRAGGSGDGPLEAVRAALDDDLDVPSAVAEIDEAAKKGDAVSEAARLLGVAL